MAPRLALRVQPRIELPHCSDRLRRIDLRAGLDPMRHAADAHQGSQLRRDTRHGQQPENQGEDRQRVPDRVIVLPPGVDDQPAHTDERGGRDQRDHRIGHRAINGRGADRLQRPLAAPASGAATWVCASPISSRQSSPTVEPSNITRVGAAISANATAEGKPLVYRACEKLMQNAKNNAAENPSTFRKPALPSATGIRLYLAAMMPANRNAAAEISKAHLVLFIIVTATMTIAQLIHFSGAGTTIWRRFPTGVLPYGLRSAALATGGA
jgi:hypothetical protein